MGLRGPVALEPEYLVRRGSARVTKPRVEKVSPKKRDTVCSRDKIGDLEQLAFTGIPGYDPRRDAGDCFFSLRHAAHAVLFFCKRLVHVRGVLGGQPFIPAPWQQSIIANTYGWRRPDGTRRYREVFETVARKNGKTTRAAGAALYELASPLEEGSEIYSAAGTRDQAAIVWSMAKGMALKDALLERRLSVYAHAIVNRSDQLTSYKSICAEATRAHGYNPQFCVVDELHTQPNRDLVDALKTGMGARQQPLLMYLTTAGHDITSVCYEIYEYARNVRDGVICDQTFLPVIYETPKEADWTDEANWKLANPNLHESVREEFLQVEFKKAKRNPEYENTFRRLFLNQWVEQETRWISVETWKTCGRKFDLESLKGQKCYGGLDLSHKNDTSAFALCFPPSGDRTFYALLVWYWLPAGGTSLAEREAIDRAPYISWRTQGFLELTPGNVVDLDCIRATINELSKQYRIEEIAFDRWGAIQVVKQLSEEDGFEMWEHGQGYASMSPAAKEFERLILDGRLRHNHNPVTTWQIANTACKRDEAGNIKPDKARSRSRIDGVVASIMAVGRATGHTQKPKSRYETKEITVLHW